MLIIKRTLANSDIKPKNQIIILTSERRRKVGPTMVLSLLQARFGPKTTARLAAVILFMSHLGQDTMGDAGDHDRS